jgi:hypothetical protein
MPTLILSTSVSTGLKEGAPSIVELKGDVSRLMISFFLGCTIDDLKEAEKALNINSKSVAKTVGTVEYYGVADFPRLVGYVQKMSNRPEDDFLRKIDVSTNFEISNPTTGSNIKFVTE